MVVFNKYKIVKAILFAATFAAISSPVNAASLHSATKFDVQQILTEAVVKFGKLVTKCCDVELYLDSTLSVEEDNIIYFNKNLSIDDTIVLPSNMAAFAPSISLIDIPLLVVLTSGNNSNE